MSKARRIVLASGNVGKVREFGALLSGLGIEVVAQNELGVGEASEPYPTFLENALTKARHASELTGLPALADDSGICVPALGGAPGVHSARFAGPLRDDLANNRLLVERMAGMVDRSAFYYCVLVYLEAVDDPLPIVAEGRWFGEILDVPRGDGGFGYDPHFYLPDLGLSAAELALEEKNRISHRARALAALRTRLSESLVEG